MDGIIVINKPKGCTSHDVVYKVKKIFNERVGHTGTLDPNATGVLPLLIGKGTKLSKYLINHDKIYEVVLKIGTLLKQDYWLLLEPSQGLHSTVFYMEQNITTERL